MVAARFSMLRLRSALSAPQTARRRAPLQRTMENLQSDEMNEWRERRLHKLLDTTGTTCKTRSKTLLRDLYASSSPENLEACVLSWLAVRADFSVRADAATRPSRWAAREMPFRSRLQTYFQLLLLTSRRNCWAARAR